MGKCSPEGWSTGNPVSTEAPQTLRLGMGLKCYGNWLPQPPALPRHLQSQARRPGAGRILRGKPKITERRVRLSSSLGNTPLLSQAFLWERPQMKRRQVRVHGSECRLSPHLPAVNSGFRRNSPEGVWGVLARALSEASRECLCSLGL